MKILGCGIVSLNLIYLILYPICETVRGEFISGLLRTLKMKMNPLCLTIYSFIAEIIVGTPHLLVFFCRLFKQNPTKLQKYILVLPHQKFTLIQQEKDKITRVHGALILIGVALMKTIVGYLLAYTANTYRIIDYPIDPPHDYETLLTYGLIPIAFFIIIALDHFVFKQPLYKHRMYSLGLLVVGMCFQLFPNIKFERSLEAVLPLYFLAYLMNGTQFVIEKWLMDGKFFTAYGLLFYEGLIGFTANVVLGYFLENVFPSTIKSFGGATQMWEQLNKCFTTSGTVGYAIGILIVKGIGQLSMMQIRYYYTPMHCGVSNFLTSLGIWFLLLAEDRTIYDNIGFIIVGHIMLFIGILVYTEIIILYFFGCHVFTTKEIRTRGDDDFRVRNSSFLAEELDDLKTIENN